MIGFMLGVKPMARNMERNLPAFLNQLKKHNYEINVVYDIGCNDGGWKRDHQKLFDGAHFYMFEATPSIKLKTRGNQTCFKAVLSDVDDREVTYWLADNDREHTGNSYYKEVSGGFSKGKNVKLKTKKLDTLVAENNLPTPQFVKMDTQGSELDILTGGEIIKQAYGVICEVSILPYNDGAPLFSDYVKKFYDFGFLPTGVHHINMRRDVINQMDIIFMRYDICEEINKFGDRYRVF